MTDTTRVRPPHNVMIPQVDCPDQQARYVGEAWAYLVAGGLPDIVHWPVRGRPCPDCGQSITKPARRNMFGDIIEPERCVCCGPLPPLDWIDNKDGGGGDD